MDAHQFSTTGESDSHRGKNAEAEAYYGCAIRALIRDWRQRFTDGHDLAFHQTLLAPINTLWGFAGIRLGQQAVFNTNAVEGALENAGVASAIDAGDPDGPWQSTLHPRNKQELGRRLSLVARALTYGEPTLIHEGPRMASVSIAAVSAGGASSNRSVIATVRFVPSTIGEHLVLGPPVKSTQKTCLSGQIPSLCGYFDVVYFTNNSGSAGGGGGGAERAAVLQTGHALAWASLSGDRRELILAASIPSNATVSSIEAFNNEWPVVTLYNSAGLPAYPFAHIVVPIPPPSPPPPPRPRFCMNNDTAPCEGAAVRPLSEAVPCGGGTSRPDSLPPPSLCVSN
jgi:hypothetical protein